MANNISNYERTITAALKKANRYNAGLRMQIRSLASALLTLDLCNEEISKLDSVTVLEQTRYGSKLAPHPAFKVQRDAADSVTRQLKQLGLTVAELNTDSDADPLAELTQKLIDVE